MRPLHELFTEAADRPGLSLPSRRGLFALAGAASAAPVVIGLESAFAQGADRKQGKDKDSNRSKENKERARERREKARERSRRRDIRILNYALTLEHLEYAFYRDGLAGFTSGDFGAGVFDRLIDIRDHEDEHVDVLTSVIQSLGGNPVEEAPCYNFGTAFNNANDFLALAQVLENTGVSAYTGAVADIKSKQLQTAGATIATVEARHAAYLNDLNSDNPFPAAFDTPLSKPEILQAIDDAGFFDCTP